MKMFNQTPSFQVLSPANWYHDNDRETL